MPCFPDSEYKCEELCGYYKHFCCAYAAANNEIDTTSDDLEEY